MSLPVLRSLMICTLAATLGFAHPVGGGKEAERQLPSAPGSKVTRPIVELSQSAPTRIDVGASAAYADNKGRIWLADWGFVGGQAVNRDKTTIATFQPQRLYQTERVGMRRYEFPAPNGHYTVLLHFVENDLAVSKAGQRVFDVTVEGKEINGIDIYDRVGGRHIPMVQAVPATVADGKLTIGFSAGTSQSTLAALEIYPDGPKARAVAAQGELVIEDFSGYGGSTQQLQKVCASDDRSNWITQSLDRGADLPGAQAMRVDYRMDTLLPYGDNPHFKLTLPKPVDLTGYRSLQFWVKPDGTNRKAFVQLLTEDGKTGTVGFILAGTEPRLLKFPLEGLGPSPWWYPSQQNPSFATKIVALSFTLKHDNPSALGGGSVFFSRFVASKEEAPTVAAPPRPDQSVVENRKRIENFDSYRNNEDLWANYYMTSHGNTLLLSLDHTYKSDGANSLRMDYTFGKKDYSGWVTIKPFDFRDYNVFRIWIRSDGSGNLFRLFFASGGYYYFLVPLEGTTPKMYEVPFRDFLGYTERLSGSIEIGFWVHKIGDSQGGTIYIDQIEVARDSNLPLGTASAPPPVPLPGDRISRINAGCWDNYIDTEGNLWLADRGYHWGRARDWYGDDTIKRPDSPFSAIFMTERYGMAGYSFAVPNGEYIVKLHMTEFWGGALAPKRRLFGVKLNGKEFPDIDIFAETGGRFIPLVRTMTTTVTDGKLELNFNERVPHGKLNGIEIIPAALAKR